MKEMMQKHTEERMTLLAREDGDADKLEEEMEAVSWVHSIAVTFLITFQNRDWFQPA